MFSMAFLGSALSSTLIYIWSRKNPDTMLSFLGLLVFKAPYLPWVLLGFSVIMHGTIPKDEMCGIVVGHSTSTSLLYPNLKANVGSLVLLQRYLPSSAQRPQPPRPSCVVDSLVRWCPGTRRRGRRGGRAGEEPK